MPNQIVQPYIQGVQGSATAPLYDPRNERMNRRRFGRDQIPELNRANSLYIAGGKFPARAWVLVKRNAYNAFNTYATDLQLQFDDGHNPPLTFQNLAIVQARCVSRGSAADPDAVYLVELTDARGILWNEWFQFPTTSQYNMRSPAYPEQFYALSVNAGTPWTWNTMVGDLWSQMSALGPYPGLPFTPSGAPENYSFPGIPAWEALNDLLDLIGCAVSVNLTSKTPYGIVQGGAIDTAFTALQAKYSNSLEDDLEYIDTGSGRVPGQVVVLFHRRNQYYGTEETIRNDSLQWTSTPYYSVTVPAPPVFASATGTHFLWDDFTVRFDVDGNPLAADVATAATIAASEVADYFNRIYRGTLGFLRQTYTGVLPFTTGSQVDGVAYRMDFALGRKGWVTEITRGPWPPFLEVEIHVD